MIISKSDIQLDSAHQYSRNEIERESLEVFKVGPDNQQIESEIVDGEQVDLSAEALSLAREMGGVRLSEFAPSGMSVIDLSSQTYSNINNQVDFQFPDNEKTALIRSILEMITGKRIVIHQYDPEQFSSDPVEVQPVSIEPFNFEGAVRSGMRYEHVTRLEESEYMQFSGAGTITTDDGKQINLDLELNMSRSYVSEQRTVLEAGARLIDPLVINFGGEGTRLGTGTFDFDLNADGEKEAIHFTTQSSGMLALDKNGDGKINDGTELFGALSGDGFGDLAQYDEDGNGFIDEADSVYQQLQIWIKNPEGDDQLVSLKDKQIGALYLGSTNTPFELKDENNQLLGVIRETGLFIREDGSTGTLQQIDIAT